MKTIIKGMTLLLAGVMVMSCSKDVTFDENAQKEAKAQAELQKKFAKYESDFEKTFGSIAQGHKWGFDQTTGRQTRTAVTSTSEIWIIPDNLANGNVKKEGNAANAVQSEFQSQYKKSGHGALAQTLDINFNNYFLQHVDQPQNIKNQIDCIEAWNSKENKWEEVTNFEKGKDTDDFTIENTTLLAGLNRSSACTTLMKDMGGQPYNNANDATDPANGKLFRVKYTDNTYNYDYYFHPYFKYYKNKSQNTEGSFLGFYFDGSRNPNGKASFWCIKIAQADRDPNSIVAEGRVLCEDMGANDFDFNDVVFDAWIMGNGTIKIKVLAHGGTLPIAIDGEAVTLGQMTNTGVNEDDTQEFTIAAVNGSAKYSTIAEIPVTVDPNGTAGLSYNLEANVGLAPQKICSPINTRWPLEYTKISLAYSPFDTWVNMSDPAEWTSKMNADKVF